MTALTALHISIGDELLDGRTVDTNAAVLARALLAVGIPVVERWTVGDEEERLLVALAAAVARAPLVVTCGGLGPTPDDRTRAALARLAGVALVEAAPVRERLERLAGARGRQLTAQWLGQAQVPRGAEILDNPVGLAPALWLRLPGGTVLCALPGVPLEVEAIARGALTERLAELPGRQSLISHTLRLAGVAESDVDGALEGVELGPVSLGFLPGLRGLDLVLRGTSESEVAHAAERVRARVGEALGPRIYGEGDVELAAVTLELLRQRGFSLRLAESCTGGWMAQRITEVPGSSEVFDRGFVTYSSAAKQEMLGVPAALVHAHGAVSAEVAAAMARGARRQATPATEVGKLVAVAVTGIAGPGGGSDQKPVGTVHVAIDGPPGAVTRRLRLFGTREQIRARTVALALDMLRQYLLADGET